MTNDRQARAARAEKMRKERDKADKRQRNTITVAIVAIVVVLIAAAGWGISRISAQNETNTEVIEPRNLTEGGAQFPTDVDNSDAPVVEIWEDFLCPACGSFEQVSGDYLKNQAEAGTIRLRIMPFAFLHNQSSNDYSHRAMNVAMCALDEQGDEAFFAVHEALFANQPEEGGAGPEDAELISMAEDAGVSGLDSCVRTENFVPWIDEIKDTFADERDITGTPTVHINGEESDARTPDELQKAIADAAKA